MNFLADFAHWLGERFVSRLFLLAILVIPIVLFVIRLGSRVDHVDESKSADGIDEAKSDK